MLREMKTPPGPALLAMAAVFFAISAFGSPSSVGLAFCGSLLNLSLADMPLLLSAPGAGLRLAAGWMVMVLSMMPPLLVPQARHVVQSGIKARRSASLAMFMAGYVSVWMLAGLVLVPAAVLLHLAATPASAAGSVLLGLLWISSPAGKKANNLCHRLYSVAASGMKGDLDCLSHGACTGTACAAACWPWMLAPFAGTAAWHFPVMVMATLLLFVERMAPVLRPAWRLPYAASLVLATCTKSQKTLGRL